MKKFLTTILGYFKDMEAHQKFHGTPVEKHCYIEYIKDLDLTLENKSLLTTFKVS